MNNISLSFSAGRRSALALAQAALLALLLVGTTACGSQYIKDFDPLKFDEQSAVVDAPENREVLEVVGEYKRALEEKDLEALRGLVAEEYYEHAGTSNTTEDDYGVSGVDEALGRLGEAVKSLRFEIVVKEVMVDGDRAFVTYEFVWNFLYEVGDIPHWEAGRDVNRMHLVRTDGGLWKISRGL